MQRKT